MKFGNLKEFGPLVLGLYGSGGVGGSLGYVIASKSDDIATFIGLYATLGVVLYGVGSYLYRKYRNNSH